MRGLLLIGGLLGLLGSVWGASSRAIGATVYVNERPVVTFRTSYRGASPASRATILAKKLLPMNENTSIGVRATRTSANVVAGGEVLIAVTAAEAKGQGSTMAALGRKWASDLSEALSLPPLWVSETYVRVPGGGTASVEFGGSKALKAVLASSDDSVAKVERKPGRWVVHAGTYGSATLTAADGSNVVAVRVEVLPYAAKLPQNVAALVTGTPANASTVAAAIETAVRTRLDAAPGAEVKLVSTVPRALRPGESATFAARVRVAAPEAYPREGLVQVTVRNLGLALRNEAELWYCNNPENVKGPGALFTAPLRAEVPARVLYHHINDSYSGMFLEVALVNDSDLPARVVVLPGDSGPEKNPVQAGIVAAEAFLRQWVDFSAEVLEIAPRSTTPLSLRRFGPQETVSGLALLRLLEGGPDTLLVRADARPPRYTDGRTTEALASSTPWRILGSRRLSLLESTLAPLTAHIYPHPFKEEEVRYQVGGRFGFVRIGQKPIANADQSMNLDGNFGVLYTINARFENPTEAATDVEMVFEASAGYSGALFVVNREVRRTPLLQAKQEFRVVRLRLAPGEAKDLQVLTMPLSGSSYPATLTVRPASTTVRTWSAGPFGVSGS